MSKPTFQNIVHSLLNWDAIFNLNFGKLSGGPWPIYKHAGDETNLASAFAPGQYDECICVVEETGGDFALYASLDGSWNKVTSLLGQKRNLSFEIVAEGSAVTGGTAKYTYYLPMNFNVQEVVLQLRDAPGTQAVIVDVNADGTSIFSTRPQIDVGDNTSDESGTTQVISTPSLTRGQKITIDVDQGDGSATGLKLAIIGTEPA